ncbi:CoA transferase [Kocuria palustris]|uniref:CoA transferase n=1 Tax=Kocuria palustris TaxID=71999 RepID=UPI0011A8620D|nr:CoA transferase [Kocuria palustris]
MSGAPGPRTATEHDAAEPSKERGALEGIVVVSIALNLPGPVAADRLRRLGASVTAVVPPSGDPVQRLLPGLFDHLHRHQQLLTLDLKSPEGQQDMEGLLAEADVLLTSSRSQALRRLGLDAEAVRRRHPRLCQVDIVGFPGADSDRPGHDLNFQAGSGLLEPDRLPSTLAADMHGAEQAVSAVLGCLLARQRADAAETSGAAADGVHAEVALSEAARDLAVPVRWGMVREDSPLGGASPYYGIYPAAEGHVAVAALEPHFADALDRESRIDADADVRPQLSRFFARRSAREWEEWGARAGVPITALADPRRADPGGAPPEAGARSTCTESSSTGEEPTREGGPR